MVGSPILDLPRLTNRIGSIREEEPTLFVDAGSFVDGASTVRSGTLSLHRPLVLDTLAELGPAVLVPGETELIAGPSVFFQEHRTRGLPYIATNWAADDEALQLPGHRLVEVDTPAGRVRLAFLGMLDPGIASQIPALAAQGVEITEPIAAVQSAVNALHRSDTPPDAVVVLTTAPGAVMEAARRTLRGVDLMMGDQTFATERVAERVVRLLDLPPEQKAAPVTMSLDGLAAVSLAFAWGDSAQSALSVVRNIPLAVTSETPPDPALSAAITRTRAQSYPVLDVPLLPAFSQNVGLEDAQWESIVCEAIRGVASVDAVFLPELPPVRLLPGPMTELQLRQRLPIMDTVTVHVVDGAKYSSFIDRAGSIRELVGCGTGKMPGGRAIDPARVYRVATTTRIDSGHILGSLLGSVAPSRVLDGPAVWPLLIDGEPVSVQAAAVEGLRQVRDAGDGPAAVTDWWVSLPAQKPPLWLVRSRQLSLLMTDFQGTQQDAFSAVPETLATSPSSFTLGSAADVAVEYSDDALSADARLRSAYTTLRTQEDGEETESADDVRVSSSLSVPAWKRAVGSLGLVPYTEVLYDTELTPTEAEDGSTNSRQSDLSLTLGAAFGKWGLLTGARIGGFANRDMAQLDDKPTEYGAKLEWGTSKRFGSALTWQTLGDAQLYASTPDDDASDLRVRALGETRLVLPLARALNINLYAQGFALKGRVPENNQWGASYTLGAALDVVGAVALTGN
jgi:hypothetical protein